MNIKNILRIILLPFVVVYSAIMLGIAYLGKGLYVGANWATGYRIDKYGWTGEI